MFLKPKTLIRIFEIPFYALSLESHIYYAKITSINETFDVCQTHFISTILRHFIIKVLHMMLKLLNSRVNK